MAPTGDIAIYSGMSKLQFTEIEQIYAVVLLQYNYTNNTIGKMVERPAAFPPPSCIRVLYDVIIKTNVIFE